MARRHYRSTRKKVEREAAVGTIVSKKERGKYITVAVAVLVFVFLKGILIGFLAGRRN